MTLAFDTNVLVYAVDRNAGERHHRAADLVESALRSPDAVLLLQTLAELSHVLIGKFRSEPGQVSVLLEGWRAALPVVAAAEPDLDAALAAVARHGLSFWDAVLWATAARGGVRHLLSEDFQDGRRLGGVTFVDPFRAANARLVEALLPAARPSG